MPRAWLDEHAARMRERNGAGYVRPKREWAGERIFAPIMSQPAKKRFWWRTPRQAPRVTAIGCTRYGRERILYFSWNAVK